LASASNASASSLAICAASVIATALGAAPALVGIAGVHLRVIAIEN
jgi:hypothetical protein